MDLNTLIQLFKSLVKSAYGNRNDPGKWEGWVDIYDDPDDDTDGPSKVVLNGKFKEVSIESGKMRFVIDFRGADIAIEARADVQRYNVFVNDVLDPEARVKVASKATLTQPLRTAVDIRPVTVDGDECRFNLRFKG